jgi:hypothetical protein
MVIVVRISSSWFGFAEFAQSDYGEIHEMDPFGGFWSMSILQRSCLLRIRVGRQKLFTLGAAEMKDTRTICSPDPTLKGAIRTLF